MTYISAWEAYTKGIRSLVQKLFSDEDVDKNSTVWSGPDGSYVVGDEYEDEYIEYVDAGLVDEYLD